MEKSVGSRIRDYRKKKNLTQDGLGLLVGVSKQAISNWENDLITDFKLSEFKRLLSALEVTESDLYGKTKNIGYKSQLTTEQDEILSNYASLDHDHQIIIRQLLTKPWADTKLLATNPPQITVSSNTLEIIELYETLSDQNKERVKGLIQALSEADKHVLSKKNHGQLTAEVRTETDGKHRYKKAS